MNAKRLRSFPPARPRWRRLHRLGLMGWLAASAAVSLRADSVINSKHDFSASGPSMIKATTENGVCIFCHAPHRAIPGTPLWNHTLSGATYIPYSSSTLKAAVGQPTGASKLCLSCHDGTVALGMVNSSSTPIQMQSGGTPLTTMPPGTNNLGTDLSHSHPISFVYDAALAAADGGLADPATLNSRVQLDHSGQLQCTACHNPHDDRYGDFLVMDNAASALCLVCHLSTTWSGSAHNLSKAALAGTPAALALHTKAKTVAENACENCHASHTAGSRACLLTNPREEQTCFSCHNGTVSARNIAAEFNKPSVHPVLQTSDLHDAMEDPVNASRHAACSDCHNPHAAGTARASAPNAPGAIARVKGVNSSGSLVKVISREYELCFRCHGDSIARGPQLVNRQFAQTNKRLEFSPANQSFHPVAGVGRNPNVPSLISPLTASSLIYCTDCHNNDQGPRAGGVGPDGPHGSAYAPLLERQLILTDYGPESAASYALCYKCHSRASILADQSFRFHKEHVVNDQSACTTCHDSHGVATNPRLINFNRNYVSPASNGRIEFRATGNFTGTCTLKCHGRDHQNTSYSPTDAAVPQSMKSLRRH